MASLTRAPLTPTLAPEFSNRQLLDEAKALTGYNPTALKSREQLVARSKAEQELGTALKSLGIEPLTVESVEKYKRIEIDKAVAGGSWELTHRMHTSYGENFIFALGLVNAVLTLICGVIVVATKTGHEHTPLPAYLVPASGWAIFGVLAFLRHKDASEKSASWVNYSVRLYEEPLPDFVVARMIDLKKALPDTTFTVQTLKVEERYRPTEYGDPFMIATYKDVSVYLDVWDEPKFEGRRTV